MTTSMEYLTSRFNWDPKTATFYVESSDLSWPVGWRPSMFTLRSHRTNKLVDITLCKIHWDEDYSGGWSKLEYSAVDPCFYGKFKVVVFND